MSLVLALLVTGCGGALSPRAVFEAEVIPVLERSCAASTCHGVLASAEANGGVFDWNTFLFHVDEEYRIVDLGQAYEASLRASNTKEDPSFSTLLRKPLAQTYGGTPHYGGENFLSPRSEDYLAVYDWLVQESGGGEQAEPLNEPEQLFADVVQPLLFGMGCASSNCHGLGAAIPFRLDPGIGGEVSIEGTRTNYGSVTKMLSLDGEPALSRILRKALPLHDGGMTHKGGNSSFLLGRDDYRYESLLAWACEEQERRVGLICDAGPLLAGIVFVRGEVEASHPFDLDVYSPGTDIYLARVGDEGLEPTEILNLTGALHDGLGDARDPAIDASGTRMVFSMRLGEDVGHEIYEMDLGSGEVQALTADSGLLAGGGIATHRDPTWGPENHIWYVSTRAGVLADGGGLLDADLYEFNRDTQENLRRSWTPHIERKPFFLVGGAFGGEVAFSVLRDVIPGQARAHPFRFPPDLSAEYHQHFGITPIEDLFFDMREMTDGRDVVMVGNLESAWVGGNLGLVDRNFGPEMNSQSESQESGLPFYAPPYTNLDPDGATLASPGTLYRDPVGLPDGRILAATSPDVDLTDPTAEVDLGIVVLTLKERLDGRGATLVNTITLIDELGISDFDPEPVYVRRAPPSANDLHWDPSGSTGLLHHQGLPMIDALLDNLSPSGAKTPRNDIRYARLVEALPLTPAERAPVPAEQTRDGVEGATTVSLGSHAPARVLGEIPLAADGTFQAEIPARIPFRIQALNEDRMAVGTMHNRWFDLHPGQVLPQGISGDRPTLYASMCATCHGGIDGSPDNVFVKPDVMTTASLTLSRYADQNPHRPLAPAQVGHERIEVGFLQDVQPILDLACTEGCHEGEDPDAGLSLSDTPTDWYNDAYESLLARGSRSGSDMAWVNEPDGSSSTSYLVELLTGREYEAPGVLVNPGMSHPEELGATPLSDEDLLTLIRWIDLGATWVGTRGQ